MKTVFHVNSGEASKQSELLGNIQNLIDDESVQIEKISVVVNSEAIEMIEQGSEASEFVEEFLDKDIEFNACSNSLENLGIDEEDVIKGVNVVGSGVGRLVELQEDSYVYIKV